MRTRTVLLAALAILALLLAVRLSGWTAVAREPLPVTQYAPTQHDDPRSAQTLAHGTFEAGGGAFAWEVFGFPHLTGGLHSFRYHVHRTGGEDARVWPIATLLLDARGYHVGQAPLGSGGHEEAGVLVVPVGYQPPSPGPHPLTAVLELEVVRDVAIGYVRETPLQVRLPFAVEMVPLRPTSEAPS